MSERARADGTARRSASGTERRTRRPGAAAVAVAVGLATTGCLAAGSPVGRVPGAEAPSGELATTPPDVWLAAQQPEEPFVAFHLDRPAYVAVFEIRGDAARTVYPSSPSFRQRRLRAGLHVVEAGDPLGARFTVAGLARYGSFGYPTTGLECLSSPVVYRMIVASHEPLRLGGLAGDVAFRFQPALSHRFAGRSVFGTMDYLIARTVPGAGVGNQGWAAYYDAFWVCGIDTRPIRRLPVLGLLRVASAERRADPPRRAPEGERETGSEAIRIASSPDAPRVPRDAPELAAPVGRSDREGASVAAAGPERIRSYPVNVNLPGSVRIRPRDDGGIEVERRGFPAARPGDDRGWSVPRPGRPWATERGRSMREIMRGRPGASRPRVHVRPAPAQRPKLDKPVKKDGGGSDS